MAILRPTMVQCLLTMLVTALLCGSGCSNGALERVVVSGLITYNGQPIPNGAIRFIPIDGSKGPISGASIIDGQYRADGLGGVPVGKYRVHVDAYRAHMTATPDPIERDYPREQYLPVKFNTKSILDVAVESGKRKQTFDFELKD